MLQHNEPDIGRRDLGALQSQGIFDSEGKFFEGHGAHRAAFGRCSQTSNQFLAGERLGPTIGLDDRELRMIDTLERGETMGASNALTAPTDSGVLFGDS